MARWGPFSSGLRSCSSLVAVARVARFAFPFSMTTCALVYSTAWCHCRPVVCVPCSRSEVQGRAVEMRTSLATMHVVNEDR